MNELVRMSHDSSEQQQPEIGFLIHPASNDGIPSNIGSDAEPSNTTGPADSKRTLEEIFGEMRTAEASLSREQFPLSQIRVRDDRVVAGDCEFLLPEEGLRRLCRRFQAPADYLASRTPSMRASLLEEHLAEGQRSDPKLTDSTSYLITRGEVFLDLGRSDLFTLENTAVVNAVREGITAAGGDARTLEVKNFDLREDASLSLDIVSPHLAEEVRAGDIIQAGVHVTHSQLNGEATQVLAYVNRLVCTNGLVQRQCLGQEGRRMPRARRLSTSHPEAQERQQAQVRKLVSDTWSGLHARLGAIRNLQSKRVVGVQGNLERFLRQAHLYSRSLMNRLLRAWEIEGSEATAFGALNALTRVATHSRELPGWQRQRLARLAGIYANQDVHLCPQCFSILVPH
ncbi:hypothetical protein BH10PLA2_BH10PLA2_26490 [soil metagenome]